MTRDEIIKLAREAGAKPSSHPEKWDVWLFQDPAMERFAALVAAAEREECAKVWRLFEQKIKEEQQRCYKNL